MSLYLYYSGSSMTEIGYNWRISVSSLTNIIAETCSAILDSLKADYLQTPTVVRAWQDIAQNLEAHWNFPNALGMTILFLLKINVPTQMLVQTNFATSLSFLSCRFQLSPLHLANCLQLV